LSLFFFFFQPAGSGVGITPALETDTALAQKLALGVTPAAETGTALAQKLALGITPALVSNIALTLAISLGITPAVQPATAMAPGRGIGIAPATETELALGPGIRLGISPALETDLAIRWASWPGPGKPTPPSRPGRSPAGGSRSRPRGQDDLLKASTILPTCCRPARRSSRAS
jgi:hypothetical protein